MRRTARAAATRPTLTMRSPRIGNVAVKPGVAGAVDDSPVHDDEVVCFGLSFKRRRRVTPPRTSATEITSRFIDSSKLGSGIQGSSFLACSLLLYCGP